jgi:hypothetical protein
MDGIIEFLVIAAVIIVGIAQQYKKSEAEKKGQERPPIPPRPNVEDVLPEPKGYDPYKEIFIPTTTSPQPKKKKKRTPTPFLPEEPTEEGTPAVASMTSAGTPASDETEENADSEYALHSTDEARKAIVWGEILQRKY